MVEGRLNPLTIILGPIVTLRQWAVPIIIAAVFGGGFGGGGSGGGGGLGGVFLLVVVGGSIAVQGVVISRTRWSVDQAGLILRTGLMRLETRTVPFDRLQNVDVVEPFLPRLLGLAELKVETAGAGGVDVSLAYLSRTVARDLARRLTDGAAAARESGQVRTTGESEQQPSTVIHVSTFRELLIAGATANRAGALAVAAGAALQYSDDAGVDLARLVGGAAGSAVSQTTSGVAIGVVIFVLLAAFVGWVVSIVESVVRFHGFQLTRTGDDIHRVFGLLNRTSASFALGRVQSVRVERALLRRWLGFGSVWADTAGSVAKESAGGIIAPIIRASEVGQLVNQMLDGAGSDVTLRPVSRAAIRRAFVPDAVIVVVTAGVMAFFRPSIAIGLAVVGLALSWWYAKRRYAALGYLVDDQYLRVRAGVLTERQWMIPLSKIQSTGVDSTYFQRRLGVATFRAHTAGTRSAVVTVVDLEAANARALADQLSMISAATAFVSDGV